MKSAKKCLIIFLCLLFVFLMSSCGDNKKDNSKNDVSTLSTTNNLVSDFSQVDGDDVNTDKNITDILVVYFSCTGNTATIAKYVSEITGSDIVEIIPKDDYSSEDLNYSDKNCRANLEQNNISCRPEIKNENVNIQKYKTVFIAFPIWWGQEPRIIDTFVENYNLEGKTVIPFCTSGGSDINTAETNLHKFCGNSVNWIKGSRFSAGTSKEEISKWINGLDIIK